MTAITCIEDLRRIARRRVPRAFFDYVEAGSYSEDTLRANRADLERRQTPTTGHGGRIERGTHRPPFSDKKRRCRLRWHPSA